MKHNLIKTDNYLLVVDDSEIKIADWYFDTTDEAALNPIYQRSQTLSVYDDCKKIISHLPLNGAQVLEGVPLLPLLEDEVEKLANEYTSNEKHSGWWAFLRGYNKAKEKYKYTEEDLKDAIRWASYDNRKEGDIEKYIEAIQQQTKYPIAFECEMEVGDYGDKDGLRKFVKTITNSQGRTEWVGKYV